VEAARSTAEKIAALSESAGTHFTADEYLQTVAESAKELSPEQLHNVAGGISETEWLFFSVGSLGVACLVAGILSAVQLQQCINFD